MINGVRVKRLKTQWPVTSTMYILRKIAGKIRNIVSLLSVGPYLSNLKKEFRMEGYEIIHVTAFPFALIWLVWKTCEALKNLLFAHH